MFSDQKEVRTSGKRRSETQTETVIRLLEELVARVTSMETHLKRKSR